MRRARRVLVIDDDRLLCELIRTTFELEGFAVDCAHDVIEAEKVLARTKPDAILLVEFADERVGRLKDLVQLMADLGLPGSVVEVTDAKQQRDIWEVRKAGLNIMMSMKGDGKPVSFIEDCAVRLEDLPDFTDRLTELAGRIGGDIEGLGLPCQLDDGFELQVHELLEREPPLVEPRLRVPAVRRPEEPRLRVDQTIDDNPGPLGVSQGEPPGDLMEPRRGQRPPERCRHADMESLASREEDEQVIVTQLPASVENRPG